MKTTYLSLLIAVLGVGFSFGASINGLDPAYSKGSTVYDGNNGDAMAITANTVSTHKGNDVSSWTMAFTISDLSVTSGTDVGLLFTYNTVNAVYKNLEGMGYKLSDSGDLTLCTGGYAYNGGAAASSPWKTQTLSGYSAGQSLTLFYAWNNSNGNVTISAMIGNDTSTLTTLASLAGSGVSFSGSSMSQINFSAKDSSGNIWSAPNGVTGQYTLDNFDLYTTALTEDQMKEYALSVVPEPATASLGLLGLGLLLVRRRRA